MAKRVTYKQQDKFDIANNNKAERDSTHTGEAKLIREIEGLVQGPHHRKRSKYRDPKYIDEYEAQLQGPPQNRYGGRRNLRLRDFRGNTYGAAGPCRSYSAEERAKFEAELRAAGTIQSQPELARRRQGACVDVLARSQPAQSQQLARRKRRHYW